MKLLQNLCCIEQTITPDNRRISLAKDILRNKTITRIFLYCSNNEVYAINPYRNVRLSDTSPIREASLFLNLFDLTGNQITTDFSLDREVHDPEYFITFPQNIYKKFDVDKSYISFVGTVPAPINLLVYVEYITQVEQMPSDLVNGSVTKKIPATETYQDILFRDVFGYALANKKIKCIKNFRTGSGNFYLDIITKSGLRLENIPSAMLSQIGDFEVWLQSVVIDYDKSYIRMRIAPELDGDNYLTLIY